MAIANIFARPGIIRAFARVQAVLGEEPFRLADGRTLVGVVNRIHRGETILPNNTRIQADAIIVATRPQFTPAGRPESIPEPLSTLTFGGINWRAVEVDSDDIHVTLFCAKNP